MRLRVGNKLYKVRATREVNPMLVRELYEEWVQRYPGQAGKTAEEIAQVWFFRIDAR
jgi:hypothetical protein